MKASVIRLLSILLGSFCFWECQQELEPIEKLYSVSSTINDEIEYRQSPLCAFKYAFVNSYQQLETTAQQNAIKEGFNLWQKVNKNIAFLQFSDSTKSDIKIQFVKESTIPVADTKTSSGLYIFPIKSVAALVKNNNSHTIQLSNSYAWDTESLKKVIAYHVGLFLGMKTSKDNSSVMYQYLTDKTPKISKSDSSIINKLYSIPCKDLNTNTLPINLKVNGLITKGIKLDNVCSTLSVKASGTINVGTIIGICTPDGKNETILGFAIFPEYNIVPSFFHAVLMYKINNETNWHSCGSNCEIQTDCSQQYVDITFHINDSDLTNNIGAYDVIVNYK